MAPGLWFLLIGLAAGWLASLFMGSAAFVGAVALLFLLRLIRGAAPPP